MMNSELNRAIAQMIRLCPDAHIIQAELKRLRAEADKRVEVVRCKDCLYFRCEEGCPLRSSGYFKNGKMLPLENDFCSYGERRGDG